jgi:hypothetical protein
MGRLELTDNTLQHDCLRSGQLAAFSEFGDRYGKEEALKGVMISDLMINLDVSSHASGHPVGNTTPAPGTSLSST